MHYIIHRDKWVCGGSKWRHILGEAGMLNAQNRMSCLGQMCKQNGVPKNYLEFETSPQQVRYNHHRVPKWLYVTHIKSDGLIYYFNTPVASKLRRINDDKRLLQKKRENRIIKILKEVDHTIEFRGELLMPIKFSSNLVYSNLCSRFGAEHVKVHSPYHIRVHGHNVWVNKKGDIKYMFKDENGVRVAHTATRLVQSICSRERFGKKGVEELTPKPPKKSDPDSYIKYGFDEPTQVTQQTAAEIAQNLAISLKSVPVVNSKKAMIYTDASVRENETRIAAIMINNKTRVLRTHVLEKMGTNKAERLAVALGLTLSEEADDFLIMNDNKGAVLHYQKEYGDKIKWIPREKNKAADKVAGIK